MEEEILENRRDEIAFTVRESISRLARSSMDFCDSFCIGEGLTYLLREEPQFEKETWHYAWMLRDFVCFAFTKSVKTLNAIERLTWDETYFFSGDILILCRSLLENYSMCKYVIEEAKNEDGNHPERLKRLTGTFVQAQTGFYLGNYKKGSRFYKDGNKTVGRQQSPLQIKNYPGEEYIEDLYEYLCIYAHCDIGIQDNYYYRGSFRYNMDRDYLMSLTVALFIFTRLYELVVIQSDEDFEGHEYQDFYRTLKSVRKVEKTALDFLIEFFSDVGARTQSLFFARYLDTGSVFQTGDKMRKLLFEMRKAEFGE